MTRSLAMQSGARFCEDGGYPDIRDFLDFWGGIWGLGGPGIDRNRLGDSFGRILSPGSAIWTHFERFS